MIRRASPSSRPAASPSPTGRPGRFARRPRHSFDEPPRESDGLRLAADAGAAPRRPVETPITRASDPRWVLALRTADLLEGPVLTHDKRQRLLRLGRLMGLSPFSANLVIAIMQDRARRDRPFAAMLADARADLALVPAATPRRDGRWRTLAAVAALLAMQALVMLWLLR